MSNYNSTLQSNNTDLQAILNQINELPEAGGVELPELSNEGSASDLLSGKELIDGEGNKITGSFTIDSELATQDDLISQIQAAVDSLPEAGGSGGESVETCTVTIRKETSRGYVYLNRCMIMTDAGMAEQWHGATGDMNFIILPNGTAGEYTLNIICETSLDIKGSGGIPAWNITGSYTTLYANSLSKVLKISGDTTIIFRDDD